MTHHVPSVRPLLSSCTTFRPSFLFLIKNSFSYFPKNKQVWDENRQFDTDTSHVNGMAEMVKQGRHHPSIIIWSVCNENHCAYYDATGNGNGLDSNRTIDQTAAATMFTNVAHALDPSRSVRINNKPQQITILPLLVQLCDPAGVLHRPVTGCIPPRQGPLSRCYSLC